MQKKYIKEVFNDYKQNNNLIEAEIENINLYKKTNKLQVKVASSKKITLQEIESFEDFLINSFKVNKASIDINYCGDLKIEQDISENWDNIIKYIADALEKTNEVELWHIWLGAEDQYHCIKTKVFTIEKLTPNEEVYFNLILRYAKQTFHEITLKKFQDKIYVDNDNVDSVVTAIEDSVGKIGFSNQYFTTPKYNLINDKISGKVTFFYVVACLLLIFGNYTTIMSGLGLAHGGFIIIGLVCIVCGSYLNSISKNYMLLTQYGENEREKWTALYNFLNSETLMNERTVIDVKLWEKYLVYATAFGISEKVCKALKIRCPETTISNSAILSNNYYRTSSFRSYSRSIGRYARSSSNTSRSSRYNGGYYGGGGSYGGGGRGGGGGGGGH